jgi:hypothetical protein
MNGIDDNPLRLSFRRIDGNVIEALPNLFSVGGNPFKYREVSRGWVLEKTVKYFNWDEECTDNAYILEAPGEDGPLTREMVDQCGRAIAEAFPELDTENLSQAEGLARLLFTGQRDLDGSFILDHLLATVEVVKQLTEGVEEPARTVAIDLAWLHRLPSAGTVSYHRPITEGLLRAWGLHFSGLTRRVMLFAMHRTESARELYSRLSGDEMTRIVALASVLVSQCTNLDRREALEGFLTRNAVKIRDFHPLTGPVLDVLGWEDEHGRALLDIALEAVDRIGLVAEVSEQLLLSTPETRETVTRLGTEAQSRPVTDPDAARHAVVSIASIYREAFRELGFDAQHQQDGLEFDRDTMPRFNEWWEGFVRSIDPGAAEAFVAHYFEISGFSRHEDFEHFLGQMVARFHRLYSSRPGAIVTCPEVIWVLLAPFTMMGGLVLGSPTHGWSRAGSGFFGIFISEEYLKSWFTDLGTIADTNQRGLEVEILERLTSPTVNSLRIVYARDKGRLRECSLEVHRVFGETWVLAQKGKETLLSVTNVADERDSLSGPLMLSQPYPSPSTSFRFGESGSRVNALREVIGETVTWLGTGNPDYEPQQGDALDHYRNLVERPWRIVEIVTNRRVPQSLIFHNPPAGHEQSGGSGSLSFENPRVFSPSSYDLKRRGFSRWLTVADSPPVLHPPKNDDELSVYRFVVEGQSDSRLVFQRQGVSLFGALRDFPTSAGVQLRFISREPLKTAVDETLAFSELLENPLLGSVWQPLASELVRVIHRLRRTDHWRLEALSPRVSYSERESPHVQVIREDDGSYHLEVGPTDSLRMDDPKVPAMMEFMGWNPPETPGLPNFWQVFESTTPPARVVTTALQTLTLMFDLSRAALFKYSGVKETEFNLSGVLDEVPIINGRYVGHAVGLRGQHPFKSLEQHRLEMSSTPGDELWAKVTSSLKFSPEMRVNEPVYAAVVEEDDPRAVRELIVLVPPGAGSDHPKAFRWAGGSWSVAHPILYAFLESVPPRTVPLAGDQLLSVARQLSWTNGNPGSKTSGDNDWRWLDLPTDESLSKREIVRGTALLFAGLAMPQVAERRRYSETQQRELERVWLAAVEKIVLDLDSYLVIDRKWWWIHPQLALVRGLHDMDASSTLAWFDDPGVDQDYVKNLVLQYRQTGQPWEMVESGTGGAWFPSAGDRQPVMGWPDPGENHPVAKRNYRFLIPENLAPGVDVRDRQDWGGPLANRLELTTMAKEPLLAAATNLNSTAPLVRVGVWELTPKNASKLARYLGEMRGEEGEWLDEWVFHVDPAVLAWADKFAQHVARDIRDANLAPMFFVMNGIARSLTYQGLYTRALSEDENPTDMEIVLEY